MLIYSIKDEPLIELAKKHIHFLPFDGDIGDDDVVFIKADEYIYFEIENHFTTSKTSVIRRCDEIDGLSSAEIKIIKELLSTYREMSDINLTLREFDKLSKEQFDKALTELLACVKRHKKISEHEEKFLYDLLSGNKTKKSLYETGVCSPDELERAYNKFVSEMQWCYGYKQPYIEHRTKNFSNGIIEFSWTIDSFIKEYNIETVLLLNIFEKILHSKAWLKGESKKTFFELFSKYCRNVIDSQEEREALLQYFDEINTKFKKGVYSLYSENAKRLISEKKTHIHDIGADCKESGLNYYRLCSAMEKLGVKPNHHIRRRYSQRLKDFLEGEPLDAQSNPKIFVISGPSCSGKTTIFNEVLKVVPELVKTVSDTTRNPREDEKDGVDYNFISRDTFEKNIQNDEYIEYNFYDDNYYGTSKRRFGELKGKKTAMIIDVNGAKNVKKIYQDAITIFIMPPSLDELRRRLVSRGDNTPEEIERRLDKAKGEIEASSNFDFVVENANLSNAVQEVSHIILNN